jgi:hypothetical protein
MAEVSKVKPNFEQELKTRAQQGEKYKKLWALLHEFIWRRGGFLISSSGEKTLRLEVPQFSELPDELENLGYRLRPAGSSTRIVGGHFVPVLCFQFRIPLGK